MVRPRSLEQRCALTMQITQRLINRALGSAEVGAPVHGAASDDDDSVTLREPFGTLSISLEFSLPSTLGSAKTSVTHNGVRTDQHFCTGPINFSGYSLDSTSSIPICLQAHIAGAARTRTRSFRCLWARRLCPTRP